MQLIVHYTEFILQILDVTDIALMCIYFCLVANNFQGADYVYNTLITEFFGRNEKQLHEFFKQIRKVFENSVYNVATAAKELVFAFLAGVLPKLPAPIRIPLAYLGIEDYLNKALDKYKSFESKKKKDEEYKAKQREIEKNRPESPDKKKKIELPLEDDAKTPGEKRPDSSRKVDLTKKGTGNPGPAVRTTV